MTRQATDQLYIDLGYNTSEEYYVYTAEAESQQTCEASVSCDASVIAGGEIVMAYGDLPSFATIICAISHIHGADLFAFADSQLAAAVEAIRDYNIESSAQFSIATDGRIFRDIAVAETSLFDLAAVIKRSRDILSETQAAFSFECDATRISANIEGEAQLSSEFSQTVLNDRIRYADSNISVESSLTATISHIEGVDIVLLPFANMTTAADIFRDVDAELLVNSSVSADVGLLNQFEAQLDSKFNFYVSRYTGTGRPRHFNLDIIGSYGVGKFGSGSSASLFRYAITTPISSQELIVPRPGQEFVIDFWYKRKGTLSSGAQAIVGIGSNNTLEFDYNSIMFRQNFVNRIEVLIRSSANALSTISPSKVFAQNQWYHIALVRNTSNIMSLYIDGVRVDSRTYNAQIRQNILGLYINNSVSNLLEVDELALHYDTLLGYDPNSTTITVPLGPRVNNFETTQFLYHFNNEAFDDIRLTVDAAAALTNATTLTSTLSGPQRFDPVSYAVTSAMSVVGTKTTEIILSAFNDAALIAEVGLEQSAQADLAIAVTSSVQAQITAEAISTQSADSQLSSEVIRIQQGAAEFDAVSAQMSVVAVIAEGIVFQEILSFMAVSAVKTTNSVALPTSATNLTALESVFRDNSSDIYFEFQQLSLINKIGEASAQISLEFQQTVDADLNADAIVLQAGEFSLSADASGSAIGIAAELTVDAYLTAEALRIQQIDSQQSSDFELTANTLNSLVAFGEADLNADTQLEGQALRIQQGIIETDSISVQMIVVLVSRDVDVAMTATSTLTSSAVKTTEVDSVISASVEQISFTDRTRDFNSLLDTTVEVNAAATKDTDIQVELFATFIQSAQGYKTTEIVLVAFDDAEMTAGVNVIADAAANMPVSTNIPILTVERTRYGTVAMDLAADLLNNITVDYSPSLQFEANTSVIANLNVLHLDLHVYRIPREQRTFVIDNEQRNYRISSETRTFKVRR